MAHRTLFLILLLENISWLNVLQRFVHQPVALASNAVWRFSKQHRAQFLRSFRQLSLEQRCLIFPSHKERWRIHRVVEALEMYPTQTVRGMAKLIGMSKTRVYETLRDASSKLLEFC